MSKFGIVVDSTVYLPTNVILENDIKVVSLNVTIDDETYKENEITREFIIDERSQGKTFRTSAPSPGAFLNAFEKMFAAGYNHVFVIGLSKELSGTYQSSMLARNMIDNPNKVTIFDTNGSAYGNEMLVYRLLDLLKQKLPLDKITEQMEAYIKNAKLLFTCENLFSLVAGGRLSSAKAMIGTVLRIKPVIEMVDGKLVFLRNERTYSRLFKHIEEMILSMTQGYKKLYIYITHTNSMKSGESLKAYIEEKFPDAEIIYTNLLGPVMTVHVGNKGFGISWTFE